VRRQGFTLLEVLVSLVILAILGAVFLRIFLSTVDASENVNARNELLHEAQVAEQIMASRVQQAWYVYPPGTNIKMNSGLTTKNALAGSSHWIVGGGPNHPFLALVLPPNDLTKSCASDPQGCYRFYAYYAFPRSHYRTAVGPGSTNQLPADPRNDGTWVLMEFRAHLSGFVPNASCTNIPVPSGGLGGSGRLLVEYVQPQTDAPPYTLFSVNPDFSVDIRLRMRKKTQQRDVRVPPPADPPLTLRAVPRNLGVGCGP